MDDQLNVLGETSPRHDPYRFWVTGILVELGAFFALFAAVFALMHTIVLVFGD